MAVVSFALTALDVQTLPPRAELGDSDAPPWPAQPLQSVSVVRLFGVTPQGASVCAHIHGFRPFFFAELSEKVAASLRASSDLVRDIENGADYEDLASPGELAAIIEGAAARCNCGSVRVVGLQLMRKRSAYGFHLDVRPFLRVELSDFRHIGAVAALLQGGSIEALGSPQAHEAHLPPMLQFLAQYNISGAGRVRVHGEPRDSSPWNIPKQTCCSLELDVGTHGVLNKTDYEALIRSAGDSAEARAKAALRARLDSPFSLSLPAPFESNCDMKKSRPSAGAWSTSLEARKGITRWLSGECVPGDAKWATEERISSTIFSGVADVSARGEANSVICDIEDLAGKSRRKAQPPAAYSDPADDPRNVDRLHMDRSVSAQACSSIVATMGARVVLSSGIGADVVPVSRLEHADHHDAEGYPVDDLEWEYLCGIFSLEVLCTGGQMASETLAAVAYTWRPRCSHLGGKCIHPKDKCGAIIVAGSDLEAARWRSLQNLSLHSDRWCDELRIVGSEADLLDELVRVVRAADPDLCLGWELQSRSWGLLLARAQALGKTGFCAALSRAPFDRPARRQATVQPTPGEGLEAGRGRQRDANDSDLIAPSDAQLAGRLTLNVWRVLMHLTFGAKLRSDAPHEAASELLGRTVPVLSPLKLAQLWTGADVGDREMALKHLISLSRISVEVMDALQVLPKAGELARLFGMDLLSGFTRGTQFKVESVLLRVAHASGLVLFSATQEQVRAQPALQCLPLVMEPCSGFYWDPVLVLDFKGMYPSLIVAHNISFDTCLGRARHASLSDGMPLCKLGVRQVPWALGSRDVLSSLVETFVESASSGPAVDTPVCLLPSGVMFVAQEVRRGLLPIMLEWALRLRSEAKRAMKNAVPSTAQRLQHRQFALKYFANVTYGYAGASFSGRMPCAEVADAIVATGRRALEGASDFIEHAVPGAKVIYGDTDSIFVQLPGATLEEAFSTGRHLCAQISASHPSPIELEFEKVYYPCVCLTKKRYAGHMYTMPPSEGGKPQFDAKGIEAVRRDQCRLTCDVQRELLEELFRTRDLSAVKKLFIGRVLNLLQGGPSGPPLSDLVFHRQARLGTYRAEEEDNDTAILPPQAVVANDLIADGNTAQFGERVAYVVACSHLGARLVDRCVVPGKVLEGGCKSAGAKGIDRWWYAEKALLPSISRILNSDLCGLAPVDVSAWLRRVPRPSTSSRALGPLAKLFHNVCSACKVREAVRRVGLCAECCSAEVRASVQRSLQEAQTTSKHFQAVCVGCAGPLLWRHCLAAAHCPNFGKRLAAEEIAQQTEQDAKRVGVSPEQTSAEFIISDSEPDERDVAVEFSNGRLQQVKQEKSEQSDEFCLGVRANQCTPGWMRDWVAPIQISDDEPCDGLARSALSIVEAPHIVEAGEFEVARRSLLTSSEASHTVTVPRCPGHSELCKEVEVKKLGPNLGRRFYACPRPREEQCKFFAWADVVPAAPSSSRRGQRRTPPVSGETDEVPGPGTPRLKRSTSRPTKSPKKRARQQRSSGGRRLERFLPAPSKKVAERIERAMDHRLLLVRAEIVERLVLTAAIIGHTGNVYNVRLGPRVECSCPDFLKGGRACKHLLFFLLRVLQVPRDDPRVWQKALLPHELRDLRSRLLEHAGEPQASGVLAPGEVVAVLDAVLSVRRELGEPCPICYDAVNATVDALCCGKCGRNIHSECFQQLWGSDLGVKMKCCPSCRAEWSDAEAAIASRATPGRPLPQQVNVAAHSTLHMQPASLEESYPSTHQWITRREGGAEQPALGGTQCNYVQVQARAHDACSAVVPASFDPHLLSVQSDTDRGELVLIG